MGPRTRTGPSSRKDHTSIPLNEIDRDWRPVFQEFRPDRNDEVNLLDIKRRLTRAEDHHGLPESAVEALLLRADKDQNGKISYEEFVDMIRGKEYEAITRPLIRRALRSAAFSVLTKDEQKEYDRKYGDEYSCVKRPPIFMFSISVLELALFIYHAIKLYKIHGYIGPNGPAPVDSRIIYNPNRRFEAWRFVSYMLVHSGYMHITFNVLVQLILGIPLEIVHEWWRILIVYLAGVVAGSLGTSITDPQVYLAGASGGVYALIAAHLAAVVLNWSEMEFGIIRVLTFGIFAVTDVGVAIYYRHVGVATNVGYVAHFAGAMAGLLVGVVVLRNLKKLKWEKIVSIICLSLYIVLMIFAIAWNVFYLPADPKDPFTEGKTIDMACASCALDTNLCICEMNLICRG